MSICNKHSFYICYLFVSYFILLQIIRPCLVLLSISLLRGFCKSFASYILHRLCSAPILLCFILIFSPQILYLLCSSSLQLFYLELYLFLFFYKLLHIFPHTSLRYSQRTDRFWIVIARLCSTRKNRHNSAFQYFYFYFLVLVSFIH